MYYLPCLVVDCVCIILGLVADCSVTNFVSNSCVPHTTDNDGLWTSIVLASELFRYHITRSLDAHKKIIRQFAGMRFLNEVGRVLFLNFQTLLLWSFVAGDGHLWTDGTVGSERQCCGIGWHLVQLDDQTWMEMESRHELR